MNKLKEIRQDKKVSRESLSLITKRLSKEHSTSLSMIRLIEEDDNVINIKSALIIAKALRVNVNKIWNVKELLNS